MAGRPTKLLIARVDDLTGATSLVDSNVPFGSDWAQRVLVPGTELSPHYDLHGVATGDFNADGITDLLRRDYDYITTGLFGRNVYDSSFKVFRTVYNGTTISMPALQTLDLTTGGASLDLLIARTADWNGDGRTDIAAVTAFTRYIRDRYFANENGVFDARQPDAVDGLKGDFNGDDRDDYLAFAAGTVNTYLSTGKAFKYAGGTPIRVAGAGRIPVDVNGDGLDDLILLEPHYDRNHVLAHVFLAKGDGTFTNEVYVSPSARSEIVFGDWNSDGLADISFTKADARELYISTGDTDPKTPANLFTPFQSLAGWGDDNPNTTDSLRTADFNGDRVVDLWRQHTVANIFNGARTTTHTLYVTSFNGGHPKTYGSDVIVKFTDGTAAETEIAYTPMSRDSVYSRATSAGYDPGAYPIYTVQLSRLLVSTVRTGDSAGNQRTARYHYAHAQTDLDRRAGLLFGAIRITDERAHTVRTTEYRQDFPFVGLPAKITDAYDNGDALIDLSVTTFDYTVVTTHPGVYSPHERAKTVKTYELVRDDQGKIIGSELVSMKKTATNSTESTTNKNPARLSQ